MPRPQPWRANIATILALALLGGGLLFAYHKQPSGRPESAVNGLFQGLSSKNLVALSTVMTRAKYEGFLRAFGGSKLARVREAYDEAFRLGAPRWQELRQRANILASTEYDRLRDRVIALGRDAFSALAVDERLKLMDDQDAYTAFLFEQGTSALAQTERSQMGTPADIRLGRDRNRFAEQQGFAQLSPDDKAIVGSAEALSESQGPAMIALHDKFGVPLLPKALRTEIGTITRADMNDSDAFMLKYGEPLAAQFLQTHQIPSDPGPSLCSYSWADQRGSLLRGNLAVCRVRLPTSSGPQELALAMIKDHFKWRVAVITPEVNDIKW